MGVSVIERGAAARRTLLRRLFNEQGGRCHYCDRPLAYLGNAGEGLPTLDHVAPLYLGGADDESNTVAACHRCNRLKSSLSLDEIRRLVARMESALGQKPPAIEALEQIELLASNHGGWFENDAWKWGSNMGAIASAALRALSQRQNP